MCPQKITGIVCGFGSFTHTPLQSTIDHMLKKKKNTSIINYLSNKSKSKNKTIKLEVILKLVLSI